eukprot:1158876-Pelagomonas_calceolata.AAC.6
MQHSPRKQSRRPKAEASLGGTCSTAACSCLEVSVGQCHFRTAVHSTTNLQGLKACSRGMLVALVVSLEAWQWLRDEDACGLLAVSWIDRKTCGPVVNMLCPALARPWPVASGEAGYDEAQAAHDCAVLRPPSCSLFGEACGPSGGLWGTACVVVHSGGEVQNALILKTSDCVLAHQSAVLAHVLLANSLANSVLYIVEEARKIGVPDIIDRCNLTALLEPGQEDLAEYLAQHRVHVVASLPCYGSENVDKQRGFGVFERSIEALKAHMQGQGCEQMERHKRGVI